MRSPDHVERPLWCYIGAGTAEHKRSDEFLIFSCYNGPDRPEITPNGIAAAVQESAYNVMMHLNPDLPRIVVG